VIGELTLPWWQEALAMSSASSERLRMAPRVVARTGGDGHSTGDPGHGRPSEPACDDLALVERCKNGDRGAFDALYRRHAERVYRSLVRMIGPSDAEDQTQQAFLEAFRSLDQFRADASFRTWLYRISVNLAIGSLRKRRRADHLASSAIEYWDVDDVAAVADETPAELTERRQLLTRIGLCVDQLKPNYRIAFVLRYAEDLSLDEIAQIMGDNAAAVGKRIKKAEREVARHLSRDDRVAAWRRNDHA
jgi:RNA polymerase sigma-70 factor, ECF subfamily